MCLNVTTSSQLTSSVSRKEVFPSQNRLKECFSNLTEMQKGDIHVHRKLKGFTLIELLVVIAIIALLMVILTPLNFVLWRCFPRDEIGCLSREEIEIKLKRLWSRVKRSCVVAKKINLLLRGPLSTMRLFYALTVRKISSTGSAFTYYHYTVPPPNGPNLIVSENN